MSLQPEPWDLQAVCLHGEDTDGPKDPREGAASFGDVLLFLFPPMNICFQALERASPRCEWEKLVVPHRPAFMTLEAQNP